ncbi:keratinocyte-associated protein 3-like [Lampetra fluviatilis]
MVCGFDAQRGSIRLMRIGLTLIVLGNLSFIFGAIVHGTVLRHVSRPGSSINQEYKAGNFSSVLSGLMCIATGVFAILLSKNLQRPCFQTGLLVTSSLCCLLTALCWVTLGLAVVLTVKSNGRNLEQECMEPQEVARHRSSGQSVTQMPCASDPSRLYDTTMALWLIEVLMALVEMGLSIRCIIVAVILRGCGPCMRPAPYENHMQKADVEVSSVVGDDSDTESCVSSSGAKVKFNLPEAQPPIENRQLIVENAVSV